MHNKKATQKSGFSFSEHCRACTKQCSEITKDAVQSTAFLLHIAEDSKGKALSGADASLRSSQSRQSMTISHLSALSWCVSYPTPRPYKRNT